jgi:hypothetical protein
VVALISTNKGEAIATLHQLALLSKGKSILSCLQTEAYGAENKDRSQLLPGGLQRIVIDGYQILPLDFKHGVPYLPCRKPTDAELQTLPHIIMTADKYWNQSIYDNVVDLQSLKTIRLILLIMTIYLISMGSMGSIDTVQLLLTTLFPKKSSLMLSNTSIRMI